MHVRGSWLWSDGKGGICNSGLRTTPGLAKVCKATKWPLMEPLWTLNIFWGKIFPPRENWVENYPSEGKFSLWGIIFPWKNSFLFPSKWPIFPWNEGFEKKEFLWFEGKFMTFPREENLPQAIFLPQKMLWGWDQDLGPAPLQNPV